MPAVPGATSRVRFKPLLLVGRLMTFSRCALKPQYHHQHGLDLCTHAGEPQPASTVTDVKPVAGVAGHIAPAGPGCGYVGDDRPVGGRWLRNIFEALRDDVLEHAVNQLRRRISVRPTKAVDHKRPPLPRVVGSTSRIGTSSQLAEPILSLQAFPGRNLQSEADPVLNFGRRWVDNTT